MLTVSSSCPFFYDAYKLRFQALVLGKNETINDNS